MLRVITLLLIALSVSAAPVTLEQMRKEPRIAMVVANGTYDKSPLSHADREGKRMRAFLEKAGFEVLYGENLDRRGFISLLREFTLKSEPGGVALFYYFGHAFQHGGKNYLLPLDATIMRPGDVRFQAIELDAVLGKLEKRANRTFIAVMETAFPNPPTGAFTPEKAGLAPITLEKSSYFLSTRPGRTAANGELTRRFVQAMQTPGISLEQGKRYLDASSAPSRTPLMHTGPEPFYFFLPKQLSETEREPIVEPIRSFG